MSDDSSGSTPEMKRSRKVLTLETKCEILDRLKDGANCLAIAREYNITDSTVRKIRRNEKSIRTSASSSETKTTTDLNIQKAEKALYLWVEDQKNRNICLTNDMVMEKMTKIYDHLSNSALGCDKRTDFVANKKWLTYFRRRFNVTNLKLVTEITLTDHQAAAMFCEGFRRFIDEKKYRPEQVFSAGKTSIFWKRMPNRTLLYQEETLACKDKVWLLFCANATGDCKIKPIFFYKKPRGLQNESDVFWSQKGENFMRWIEKCFVPEVKEYLAHKNLPFKIVLIVERTPYYSAEELKNFHPDIEILFLPQATDFNLAQPLEYGFFKFFFTYYTRRLFTYAYMELQSKPCLTLSEWWYKMSIGQCVDFVKEAYDEVQWSIINSCWRDIWKEAVTTEEIPNIHEEIRKIEQVLREIGGEGLDDVTEEEVQELIDSHNRELNEQYLEEMVSKKTPKKTTPRRSLTANRTRQLVQVADNLNELIFRYDPSIERRNRFQKNLNEITQIYTDIEKSLEGESSEHSLEQSENEVNNEPIIEISVVESDS